MFNLFSMFAISGIGLLDFSQTVSGNNNGNYGGKNAQYTCTVDPAGKAVARWVPGTTDARIAPCSVNASGEQRAFLLDGDAVILRDWCEKPGLARIGFGESRGRYWRRFEAQGHARAPILTSSKGPSTMTDITQLFALGTRVGNKLVARSETVAVAESSAGGLISAALLARAGASAYYFGGAVLYTRRSRRLLTTLTSDDTVGMRSSSPPYAQLLAQHQRTRFRASWGLAETGAAGPTGNPYGDPAGHTCLAVDGPVLRERLLRTGLEDRTGNMIAFATAALELLEDALDAASLAP